MLTVPDSIKDLLHLDSCQKNIRIHFPNGERSDICNDLIVLNSVSFTESICSQNTLKFGLCEAPMFECEVVGVGNIKGAIIEVSCEIYCPSAVSGAVFQPDIQAYVYSIPYGVFIVQSSTRQADMAHRRIVAYGGDYLSDWEFVDSEYRKHCFNTVYTPNVGFMLAANGYNLLNDLVDEEEIQASRLTARDTGFGRRPVSASAKLYEIEWRKDQDVPQDGYRIDWDYLFRVDFSSFNEDFEKEIWEFWTKYANVQVSFEGFKKNAYQIFNNEYREWDGTRRIRRFNPVSNGFCYPHIDGFYSTDQRYFRWMVIGEIVLNAYSGDTIIDSKTVKVFNEKPKFYKITYKSAYSALGNFALSVPTMTTQFNIEYPTTSPNWSDYDLRKLVSGFLEMRGLLGTFYRDDPAKVKLLNIKRQFGLNPSATQYPGSGVYPQGVTGGKLLPQDYQSCWYDDDYAIPYGAIKFKYISNGTSCEGLYYLSGYNEDTAPETYKVLDITNNEVLKYASFSLSDMTTICSMIEQNISGVSYMPVQFVGRGLPYVEAGDTFEILTKSNDSITTIVLNRTLSGEQVLTDSYKSV